MLTPDQFQANEAWIAIRVNEEFILVEDEPCDIFVLLDAASEYVFGFVLSRVVDESPDEKEVEDLFRKAWEVRHEWARKLIIVDESSTAKEMGTEKFVADEQARYICPECGNEVFRGVVKCNQCNTKLDLD